MPDPIYSFLSFDVEALPGRAANNPLETLVWGKTPSGDFGLPRIISILDEFKIKGCFMIDLSIAALYGDEPCKQIFDFILERGHEVHIHLHTEWLMRKWAIKTDCQGPLGMDQLNGTLSDSALRFAAWKFTEFTKQKPSIIRSGAFLFNQHTVDQAKRHGFAGASNLNTPRHDTAWKNSPLTKNEPFCWQNGLIEIPVDFSPEPLSFDWNKYIGWFDRARDRKTIKTFNLVMHSWSLFKREDAVMTEYSPAHEERLRTICTHLASNTIITTYNSYISTGKIKNFEASEFPSCSQRPCTALSEIYTCNICGYSNPMRPEEDLCPSCKSRSRHRQIQDVFERIGNPFCGKRVLVNFASPFEFQAFLSDSQVTNFDIRPVPGIDFQMDIQDMSRVEDASYDAFFAVHVLNHVGDDSKALREVYRILKPGGLACLTIPYRENDSTKALPDTTKHYGENALRQYGVGSFRVYGLQDALDLFGQYFSVKQYEGIDALKGSSMLIFVLHKE